ncbi:8839_t:CDS:2, partial [Paraglomus occultum]
ISKADQPASSASSFSHVLVYPNTLNISKLSTMGRKPQSGDVLEYRIPSSYLTFNQASTKQIWGVGIYTYDSDIVKAIAHSGIYRLKQTPPDNDLSVKIRYSPGLNLYCGAISNSFKSDEHKQCSLSYVIESVSTIPKGSANA